MRYTREGGFRCGWLARLTDGRFGLGRWTRAERDSIQERVRIRASEFEPLFDDDDWPLNFAPPSLWEDS